MARFLLLALTSCMFVIIFAEAPGKAENEKSLEVAEKDYDYYKPCPCKCYIGHKKKFARKECHYYYYGHCKVSRCYDDHYGYYKKKGLHCCDDDYYPPPPPPPPKPSPKPKCPCYCTTKGKANKQCKYLYPYCKVIKCYGKHYYSERTYKYPRYPHYPKPKKYYECCYAH